MSTIVQNVICNDMQDATSKPYNCPQKPTTFAPYMVAKTPFCQAWGSDDTAVSPGKRPLHAFSCQQKRLGIRRLCWCAGPTVALFNHDKECKAEIGKYFTSRTSCDQARCINAKKGEYYSSPSRSRYFNRDCDVEACERGKPGFEFAEGWANSPTSCPIQQCGSRLSVGKKYGAFGDCELKDCTNAPTGKYYTSDGSVNGECEFADCDEPPLGMGYVTMITLLDNEPSAQ